MKKLIINFFVCLFLNINNIYDYCIYQSKVIIYIKKYYYNYKQNYANLSIKLKKNNFINF